MRLLVTSAYPTLLRYRQAHLGRLIQPRHYSSIEETAHSGMPWAADNDAFGNFDAGRYRKMLDRIWGLPGCLFVTAPDVVGDSTATRALFEEWYDELAAVLQPLALVAQDGLVSADVPWQRIAALFIGGTTEWKMGAQALSLVCEAQVRGKWVHFGRVNSRQRIRYAYSIRCDSCDGSKYARWRDTYLPGELAHLAGGQQLPLEEPCA